MRQEGRGQVQFSSVTQSCPTLCDPMDCSMPGFPVHHQLPELAQTHVHRVRDAIQPSHPLSSPSPPAFNLSQCQGLLQGVSSSYQVVKYWSFFSISPSNEYSGLISFRMDWLDLLAVQGTLKSLLQHHSSETSIFQHSAFFIVQLPDPYMTTGKTIALIRWTFIGEVLSLLFDMLLGFPCSSGGKESACSAGNRGSIPGLGRSPGEGNGNPLHYPCLENLMDRRAWWAAVNGVARLSD